MFGLDNKLDAILNSISDVKKQGPFDEEQAQKLDQLISLRLKHTIEEVEQ